MSSADRGHSRLDRRRNYAALLAHGLLGMTGFRLLQAPTFLPTYINLLTGANAAVGVASACQSLGMFVSPLLSAALVEHRRHVKWVALLFGGVMRFQMLLLALVALLAPVEVAVFLVWPVLLVWGFSSGMQMVAFNLLFAKSVPVGRRGRLQGTRNLAAGTSVILLSVAAGWVLDRYGFPRGYGLTFLGAALLAAIGLAFMGFIREPAALDVHDAGLDLRARLGKLPALLRSDPHYARFLSARLLTGAARGALPFYVLLVGERFGVSGARLAGLTVTFAAAQSVGALVWGLLGDRSGYRAVYVLALGSWILGSLTVLWAPVFPIAYAVFLLVGAGFSGVMLASQNLVLEFGRERDRPMRIAATHSLAEASGVAGFLTAGVVSQVAPIESVFLMAIVLHLLALRKLIRIEDPRRAARRATADHA